MNWTSTPPTKPGFYLWRINAQDKRISMREIFTPCNDVLIDRGSDLQPKDVRGQWLRLVPAEEVEKLQKRNDDLTASIKKFVHRCEIGEIRSRKTYAEFCALLDVAAPNK